MELTHFQPTEGNIPSLKFPEIRRRHARRGIPVRRVGGVPFLAVLQIGDASHTQTPTRLGPGRAGAGGSRSGLPGAPRRGSAGRRPSPARCTPAASAARGRRGARGAPAAARASAAEREATPVGAGLGLPLPSPLQVQPALLLSYPATCFDSGTARERRETRGHLTASRHPRV